MFESGNLFESFMPQAMYYLMVWVLGFLLVVKSPNRLVGISGTLQISPLARFSFGPQLVPVADIASENKLRVLL